MSRESRILKTGKFPGSLLQDLIEDIPKSTSDRRLSVGPGVSEDAAHILIRRKHRPRHDPPGQLSHGPHRMVRS